MFQPVQEDIEMILTAYGIVYHRISVAELQRSIIKNKDNVTYDIRLILRADAGNGKTYVIRMKKEKGVDLFLLENQCKFAEALRTGKIKTPYQYHINGRYANSFKIQGHDILVTVEEFVYGEITCVDEEIAHKTGRLLARMHEIAETQQLHVDNQVLFNPFERNELFGYSTFCQLENDFYGADLELFQKIVVLYENYLTILEPLRLQPKYAVRGYMTLIDAVTIICSVMSSCREYLKQG